VLEGYSCGLSVVIMADADQRKQKQRLHLQGTLIVFLGVLWLTPDSLLIKLVESDGGWETLFWRHVFYFATMTAGLLAHAAWSTPQAAGESTSCCCQLPRAARIWMGQIKATGRFGAVWVAVQVPGNLGFIIGQSHTTAANVLIVVSTTPLWSALFSRVFLREPVPLRTVIAIAGAMAAIVALFWGELAVSSDELTGLLLALMCAVSLAINFTLLRRAAVVVPDALFPALFPLQSLVCGGIALAFGAQPGSVLPGDMKWLALQGCCVVPLSFIALTVGPKYISAAEVSLFLLLETVLGP
jgi:drug/metabolite transporter (DMT)-like permease